MQAVPQARRSGLPSSVCGDFPDFDVLERDCGGRVLLDPFACLLRRIFRFEDDHREPVVLFPRPIARDKTRRLRHARDHRTLMRSGEMRVGGAEPLGRVRIPERPVVAARINLERVRNVRGHEVPVEGDVVGNEP